MSNQGKGGVAKPRSRACKLQRDHKSRSKGTMVKRKGGRVRKNRYRRAAEKKAEASGSNKPGLWNLKKKGHPSIHPGLGDAKGEEA